MQQQEPINRPASRDERMALFKAEVEPLIEKLGQACERLDMDVVTVVEISEVPAGDGDSVAAMGGFVRIHGRNPLLRALNCLIRGDVFGAVKILARSLASPIKVH